MARFFSVNYGTSQPDIFWFELKRVCKLAGHTIPRSSDGLSYNSSGDQITGTGSGAGGISNNKSWFVLQQPDGRQWCIQRGNATTDARIKFSRSAGFTGGAPSATQVPSATDEDIIYASGTDAVPVFATFWTAGNRVFHVMADNASPYGWYGLGYNLSAAPDGHISFDPLATGSYDSRDAQPYALWCYGNNLSTRALLAANIQDDSTAIGGTTPYAPRAYLLSNGVYTLVTMAAEKYDANDNVTTRSRVPITLLGSHVTNKDPTRPIIFSRKNIDAFPSGEKGASSLYRWPGTPRIQGDVYTVRSVVRSHVLMNSVLVPWDGTSMCSL